MHLLAARPGLLIDGSEAVDLRQSPGDIAILSAADTELALLADAAQRRQSSRPVVRLASTLQLAHNLSVDTWIESVASHARIIVARMLGGASYWRYGTDELTELARRSGCRLVLLPGDDREDPELRELSSISDHAYDVLWSYLNHGGSTNADNFLGFLANLCDFTEPVLPPQPFARSGCYWPAVGVTDREHIRNFWAGDRPVVAIVFYRALVQAADTAPIDMLVDSLTAAGLNPLPVFSQSLREPGPSAFVEETLARYPPSVIVNCTGFSLFSPDSIRGPTPFDTADCPIIQAVLSSDSLESWETRTRGLAPRDIAMNVALPEVDGRIFSRAISFKSAKRFNKFAETSVVRHEPLEDRVDWTAALAAAWVRLGKTPVAQRRVAMVLANYPGKTARIGNGVGLDTPASAVNILVRMYAAGYRTGPVPDDGGTFIRTLIDRKTRIRDDTACTLDLDTYQQRFSNLPAAVRKLTTERWGAPVADPTCIDGAFRLHVHQQDNIVIGVQPGRGYGLDPKAAYHDPDLPPPHSYLAFYFWIIHEFGAHAVIQLGKHGNLEWLPGKSLALSESCFPEAVFAPIPLIYPFIVNDPGEGTQAKRRNAAVIVDHLTPPLTRAGTYGALNDLEQLVDEYFTASQTDPRRLPVLARDILDLCSSTGLDQDCGFTTSDDEESRLSRLDGYLCELKEMQIRDGLHILGDSPQGELRDSLLVALARMPRRNGDGESLIRALARDLSLAFDPLDADMSVSWASHRPPCLEQVHDSPWRTNGDTIERLELLASALVAGRCEVNPDWHHTAIVLKEISETLAPAVEACGERELTAVLDALDGRFIEPGPSGAPSRGRPEVLPTGRNFFSVDTRVVPTAASWQLGSKSAARLLERHVQEHGVWPRSVALSAWGTANMRTGGDDIAQAMALIGARPVWEKRTGRVTGFDTIPLDILARPRVDVTLRVSGFFRDAFPSLIDLFDNAVRRIAELDEPSDMNPLAAHARREAANAAGDPDQAWRNATIRVFGSKPGAYGAGLQALIDDSLWETDKDLARAFVSWSGYAYGAGSEGIAAHDHFENRLAHTEVVIHNQDNREHDLLDSDDYYQFEGGMTAAVRHASGSQPTVYHNDHSRPESPAIRTLQEEIARVVRARVVNPKWIAGVMRHGYKGAFEMAATVDYLFGFAASARCVADHHFDAVYDAWLADDTVRRFISEANPHALRDIALRMSEAQKRGLWKSRRNSTMALLDALIAEKNGGHEQ